MTQSPPIEALLAQARQHHAQGAAQAALAAYQAILAQQPDHAGALHGLGVLGLQHGQPQQAERALAAANRAAPQQPALLCDWATALHSLEQFDQAIMLLQQAVTLDPMMAAAWLNLGNALAASGQDAAAVPAFARAEALGAALAGRAAFNLGNALSRLGQHQQAAQAFSRVISRQANHADAHNNLGVTLLALHQPDQALQAFAAAEHYAPSALDPLLNRAETLARHGAITAARQAFAKARQLAPKRLRCQWADLLGLPLLYDSEQAIDTWRAQFADGLDRLDEVTSKPSTDMLEAILTSTAFPLNYHGRDDRALQSRYAALVARIGRHALARYHQPGLQSRRPAGRRIRVGIVSDFLSTHSITKTHGGWITGLDPQRFEVMCLHTGAVYDETSAALARQVARFTHCPQFGDRLLRMLHDMQADLLIYPDIGMSPTTQVLAALRMAPIQVNGLGHPVTSGFDSIDYAISAALAEPANGQQHYTETLALLPNLAMDYQRQRIVAQQTAGLSRDAAPVLFCSQSLFKLLPQHDRLFARIAAALPVASLWFLANPSQTITHQFTHRLARAFAAEGLDWQRHCVIQPRQGQNGFMALNQRAHLFLDAPGWSGNNSALEALACGLLPITLPGPLFRQRHTLAILRRIGLDGALVATDEDDYVRRVVALITQPAHLAALRDQAAQTSPLAFNDPAPSATLAELIIGWVGGH